jgi:hypothetical protein
MQPALAFSNAQDSQDSQDEAERSSEMRIVRSAAAVLRHLGDTPSSTTLSSNYLEVHLPMRLSHKWVAYACRTAGVAKPRWNRITSVWTTNTTSVSGARAPETISITASSDGMRIRILVELTTPSAEEAAEETTTARRLATAFVTTMRDGMRRRTVMRECYAELSRAAAVRNGHGF